MQLKSRKIVSGLIVGFLFAFLLIFSAHFHPGSAPTEKDNCSICQVSHSFQRQDLSSSNLRFYFPTFQEELYSLPELTLSKPLLISSQSRAPPTNA